jgi:hypothetical protein
MNFGQYALRTPYRGLSITCRRLFIWSLIVSPCSSAQTPVSVVYDLPIERRAFEQIGKPIEDDTPGALSGGGYCWRDVLVTSRSYRAIGRELGGATVEVIHHASSYPYVVRDFFGMYRGANVRNARARTNVSLVDGVVDEGNRQWRFIGWTASDGSISGTICSTGRRKANGDYAGNVGWYHREGDRITTVVFFFSRLDGVPYQLVDKYLKKYPSSTSQADFHGETWVADDVQKWLHLLELTKEDRVLFNIALVRLASYDPEMFDARDTFMSAATQVRARDLVAIDETIAILRAQATAWLAGRAERSETKGD